MKRITWRRKWLTYFHGRGLNVLSDGFDGLSAAATGLMAPVRLGPIAQAKKVAFVLSTILLLAFVSLARGGAFAWVGLCLSLGVVVLSVALLRTGSICDRATERALASMGAGIPALNYRIPNMDPAIMVAGVAMLFASPLSLYALSVPEILTLLNPPDGTRPLKAVLYTIDQIVGVVSLDLPDVYHFSLSGASETNFIDRFMKFTIRALYIVFVIVAIFRVTRLGAPRAREQMALANLRHGSEMAILVGERMVAPLRKLLRSDYSQVPVPIDEFIARARAVRALGILQGIGQ